MRRWQYPPDRTLVSVPNSVLRRALLRDAFRYATLEEYSKVTGLGLDEVIEGLEDGLDSGAVALEAAVGEIFVLTAPSGRPIPRDVPEVAPNLWEVLRYGRELDDAVTLWKLQRALERAGWEVLAVPSEVNAKLESMVSRPAPLGVRVGAWEIPLLVFPADDMIADSAGMLGEYERAGAPAVGIVCAQSALDRTVTAARRFALSQRLGAKGLTVVVLEAPRFQPVLLQPHDTAVNAVSVTRGALEALSTAKPR